MEHPSISVVIPVLNEAENVGELLEHLKMVPGLGEIIIVDGGSTDGTLDLVLPPARLASSEAGRGNQLNVGAREATGEVLFFLHADVVPAVDGACQIRAAINAGYGGGTFRLP
jgi:glycosyltransferase involved in cell wall biosynthesis